MNLRIQPISDPYGYDAYRLRRAKVVPTGFAIIVLGLALGSFSLWLPHLRSDDAHALAHELSAFVGTFTGGIVTLDFADNNAIISLVVMIFLVIGISMLGYARTNRRNYMAAYPRIKDFYTDDEKRQALKVRRRWVALGVIVLIAGLLISVGVAALVAVSDIDLHSNRGRAIPIGVFLTIAAPAVWMIAHGVIVGDRVDIFEYNYQALSLTNRYDIQVNQTGERQRVMLGENRIETFCHSASHWVVVLGVFVSVMMVVLPSLRSPYAGVPFGVSLCHVLRVCLLRPYRACRQLRSVRRGCGRPSWRRCDARALLRCRWK